MAVTGATGFVGRALVAQLVERGCRPDRLRLLVRDAARARQVLPRAQLVVGHLNEPAALQQLLSGADVVFHLGGAIKASTRRGFYATNAAGTAALVAALRATAPRARLVHVSSLAAAGPTVDGATSAQPPEQCTPRSHYGESKRQGELAVRAAADLTAVILRPPVVYGPGDPATGLLLRQACAPCVAVPWMPRPLSILHIRDLVTALCAAAERLEAGAPLAGRVVPLEGPDRVDTDSLMRGLAAAAGRRARLLRVPLALAWPAACAGDLLGALQRTGSLFGRDKLKDLRAAGWVADAKPARELLAFAPAVPTRAGFAEVARAFATNRGRAPLSRAGAR